MTKQLNTVLITLIFSIIVSHDVIRGGNTYIHLVGFDKRLNISNLQQNHNLIDFLLKFLYINIVLFTVNLLLSIFINLFITHKQQEDLKLIKSLNQCLISHLLTFVVFETLFVFWVKMQYSETLIHRAVLFGVIYMISRVAALAGEVLGYFMQFYYFWYPGLVLGIVLGISMVFEAMGFDFINTFFD